MAQYSRHRILTGRSGPSPDRGSRESIIARPQSPLVGPVASDDRGGLLVKRHGAGGGFTPAQLTSLVLWLDAAQGITLDGSSNVSAWADQSGQGNDFQQTSAGARPGYSAANASMNGRPSVDFASDWLEEVALDSITATAGTPITAIGVWHDAAGDYLISNRSGGGTGFRLFAPSAARLAVEVGFTIVDDSSASVGAGLEYIRGTFSGSTAVEAFVDGATNGATTGTDLSGSTLSSGSKWAVGSDPGGVSASTAMSLSDLFVMHAEPTSEELASLAAFLDARYGRSVGAV